LTFEHSLLLIELMLLSFDLRLLSSESRLLLLRLLLLRLNYQLLLPNSIEQNRSQLTVFDAFDLSLVVVGNQERFDSPNFFGAESHIAHSAFFPIEHDRTQTTHDVQSTDERLDRSFVAQGRGASGDFARGVCAYIIAAAGSQRLDEQITGHDHVIGGSS
jgi:hypothetical protein